MEVELRMTKKLLSVVFLAALTLGCGQQAEQPPPSGSESAAAGNKAILGRWDVTVVTSQGRYPSWFEVAEKEGGLAGRFVGRVGSARPIQQIHFEGGKLHFKLPVQYESHNRDLEFTGTLGAEQISGMTNAEDGSTLQWKAVRAPQLVRAAQPAWGEPIQLFNGKDTSGWKLREPEGPNGWEVQQGVLTNTHPSVDLVTEQAFEDFKLHVEFRYSPKSNSGIYLRGRYEVQIQDDFGKAPTSVLMGGVYGFLTPSKMAAKKAGQWQTYDITLEGRHVTVVLNGERVIDDDVAGITGGALDSNEGEPGPLFLQGDHPGSVSFRKVELTPAK